MIFDTAADRLVTARLLNWGLWASGGMPELGYPAYYRVMHNYFPTATRLSPDGLDAAHIEYILSSLDVGSRRGIGWGQIYAFVCKLEFIEIGRPREVKAEYVRRKYRMPCSERTFRYHLARAKRAVHIFADPL